MDKPVSRTRRVLRFAGRAVVEVGKAAAGMASYAASPTAAQTYDIYQEDKFRNSLAPTNASAMSRLLHENGLIGYVQTPRDMPDGTVKIVTRDRSCTAQVRALLKANGYASQYATGLRTVRVIGRRKA